MSYKKLLLLLLAMLILLSFCACRQSGASDPPQDSDSVASQEAAAALFNAAVDKLNAAGSYTMTGNVTSAAEMQRAEGEAGELVTVYTPLNCTYQDGKMLMISENGSNPHTTYFDGTHYYISVLFGEERLRYFVSTNDYTDYDAAKYLKQVDAEAIFHPSLTDNAAGGKDVSFQIPFALYDSEALRGWLGEITDDTLASRKLQITAAIDKDGYPTAVFFSFSTTTQFSDDKIQQELAVSFDLSDFSSTVVSAPADLETYEDWTISEAPTDESSPELTPEDMY